MIACPTGAAQKIASSDTGEVPKRQMKEDGKVANDPALPWMADL
jgi:hypothetical protein